MATARDRQPGQSGAWDATWEGNRRSQLDAGIAATPAQRLAWLEEALELAYRCGALSHAPGAAPGPGSGTRERSSRTVEA